jgi:hypothetical protein
LNLVELTHRPRSYGPEQMCSDVELALADELLDRLPYYKLIPKDWKNNLLFRQRAFREADRSASYRQVLWDACAQDPLFFFNLVGCTYDPRPPYTATPVLPLVTFEYQDDLIVLLIDAIQRGRNVRVEKSRAMSFSWCMTMVFEWMWHFRPYQSFRMLSYKQDLVDKTGDMKSLFQKLDFFHEKMPPWLVPRRERNLLHLRNLDNNSLIDGESTTSRSARGGRDTAIGWDEVAFSENAGDITKSMRSATACKIMGSTANGDKNLFYEMRSNPSILQLRLHWSMHPVYRRGLYRDANGKLRSPWYDHECGEALHPHEIGQELDIDYSVQAAEFYRTDVLERVRSTTVRPPVLVGEVVEQGGSIKAGRFVPQGSGGRLTLWFNPVQDGVPPSWSQQRYIIGADVATGTAPGEKISSNSCLAVIDVLTGEKVAEYVDPHCMPHEFARSAAVIGWWFKGDDGRPAEIVPESQGPGQTFIRTLLDLSYPNVYMRKDLENQRAVPQDKPGFYMSRAAKRLLLEELARVWDDGTYTERSNETIREAAQFIFFENGSVGHVQEKTDDPTGKDSNHGDRVMATALAWWQARGGVRHTAVHRAPPPGSLDAIVLAALGTANDRNGQLWCRKGKSWVRGGARR